jgi:hypothetical protein
MDADNKLLVRQLLAVVHRYRFVILAALVGGLGAILISRQSRFPAPDVARDFGIALFAAGTIALAVEFYTRQQFRDLLQEEVREAVNSSSLSVRLNEVIAVGSLGGDLRELGVRRIHRNRNQIDFLKLIKEAEPGTEIRLLGVCLAGFMDRNTQMLIEQKLRHNCTVKLLILDPESEAVRVRAVDEQRTYDDIKQDIEGAEEIHNNFIKNRIRKELRNRIYLGHYSSVPAYFIFCTNSTMIVGFYLRSGLGEFFPQLELEIKEGGIHLPFNAHYESLWNERREVSEPQQHS